MLEKGIFEKFLDDVNKDSDGETRATWNSFGLTIKQFLFCQEYLKDFNATRAAKAVYRTIETGSQCMRSKAVQRYIRHRLETKLEAAEADWDYVLKRSKSIVEERGEDRTQALKILKESLKALDDVKMRMAEREAEKEKEKEQELNITLKVVDGQNSNPPAESS